MRHINVHGSGPSSSSSSSSLLCCTSLSVACIPPTSLFCTTTPFPAPLPSSLPYRPLPLAPSHVSAYSAFAAMHYEFYILQTASLSAETRDSSRVTYTVYTIRSLYYPQVRRETRDSRRVCDKEASDGFLARKRIKADAK